MMVTFILQLTVSSFCNTLLPRDTKTIAVNDSIRPRCRLATIVSLMALASPLYSPDACSKEEQQLMRLRVSAELQRG
jgi:hypothetical protein